MVHTLFDIMRPKPHKRFTQARVTKVCTKPVARKFAECIIVAVVTNAIAELRYQISRDFRRAGADKRRQCR